MPSASWHRRPRCRRSYGVIGLALVLTSASSRGEREFSISSGGGVAGSGVGPGPDDQDDGFVQGAAPGVTFTIRVVLLTAVLGTGLAKLAEGDE